MIFWVVALGGLTLLRLVLAATIPLSPDETYYWIWSTHLQAGYYDHPPMVAYWIRAGTAIFGSNALGVRVMGPVAAAGGSVLLWDAGENFLPKRHAGLVAAALFNATIILGVGSVLMTPDTPLVFFWVAALAALGRLYATREGHWWLAVGAASGAAMLSKYTGVLLVAGVFFWLVPRAEGRAALRTGWPWAGGAVACLVFGPDFWWNAGNHWVSFFKQGGRIEGFDFGRSAGFLGELLAGQFFLVTPLIACLAVAGLWRIWGDEDAGARLLLWVTLLPAAVFLEHVVSGRVQANWPAVILPGAFLAAPYLPEKRLGRWLGPALGVGFGCTLLAYAQAVAAPFPVPAAADPTALQLAGWRDFADEVVALKPDFVVSDEYSISSELAFYMRGRVRVEGFDKRWDYLTLPMADAGAGTMGILVTARTDAVCPKQLAILARRRGAAVIQSYRVCQFAALPGMLLLPHP